MTTHNCVPINSPNTAIVTLSGVGKTISGWSSKDGSKIWSASVYSFEEFDEKSTVFNDPHFDGAFAGDLNNDGVSDVVVLALDRVQARSGKDGRLLWTWKPSGYAEKDLIMLLTDSLSCRTGHSLHKLHLAIDGTESRAYVLGLTAGEVVVTVLGLNKGTPTKTQTLKPTGKISPKEDCVTVQPGGQLVCVDANGDLVLAEMRVSAEFTKLDLKVSFCNVFSCSFTYKLF